MQLKSVKKIVAALTFFNSVFAFSQVYQEPVITSGYPAYQLDAVRNVAKTFAIKSKELNIKPYSAMTFTNLGSGDIYYALYSNMHLRAFNLTSKQLLGDWQLGNTAPCVPNGEEDEQYQECIKPWYAGRWTTDEVLESALIARLEETRSDESFRAGYGARQKEFGCLTQHPLRYGDLTGDGQQELIVVMRDSLAIFSLQSRKTIFAAMFDFQDWKSVADLQKDGSITDPSDPENVQYGSTKMVAANQGFEAAYRAYAKLYAGDFNNDGKGDLVVWRKQYQSRLVGDSTKGFIKQSDNLIHYALINGTYKKQTTESADVKAWLTSKNLTWSKGYPNKSECAGQTDKLIPEIHDPLLNDAEVLQ
jgi:hypothetical protein